MSEESLTSRVLHLRQVEKLSQRQIAQALGISRKRVRRILDGPLDASSIPKISVLDGYDNLVAEWYKQYPRLKATQVYERLIEYGYKGAYASVARFTKEHRSPRKESYHPLVFLPGEEAQIDWFFFNHERLGQVAGFLYLLSYSRYAWGIFYPKTSFEFFLAGHIECFKHIGGLAHRHRYDNLKSVVLKRSPSIEYNPQFLDFARFYGFSIHVCNPYSGNEKGRVERLIRDIRSFLYSETFIDISDLNQKFHIYLERRNITVHRSTKRTPKDLLKEERLLSLPSLPYPARRVIQTVVSKTALVEFETNRYSAPSSCAGQAAEIIAYPDRVEICMAGKVAANHLRRFDKNKMIQNPLHAEALLNRTPSFKMRRILQVIRDMDPAFGYFFDHQDNDDERMAAAYQLFILLKTHSKGMLVSAVRELNALSCLKIKALLSRLNLPEPEEPKTLWPKDGKLLNLTYEERRLDDYDPDSPDME
ncbi:MAG: IS21 family transposase [Candidatus Omnitrophica bacterium]|nr:IS21 family transposase [Candidatus Omnitrophota bacterium]